jgi:transcriptional regulator GlxA family with amidase domain
VAARRGGAHVPWAAGLARGKRATTHWTFIETLRSCTDMTVIENTR